jgi:AcrR family transcriptional regulator
MSIPPKPERVKTARPYASPLRHDQATATRQKIVEAALNAFLEHGYAGATMQKIAASAGVVVETIYRTFDGKAGVFRAAIEAAVAGGSERAERPIEQRPAIRAVIDEPDPRRKLQRYANTQPGIHQRLTPLYQMLEQATAIEPTLHSIRAELEMQRLDGMTRFAQHLMKTRALRRGMSVDEARDILWTINSHEVHRMLVTERGWSPERYRDWLARTLASALLAE